MRDKYYHIIPGGPLQGRVKLSGAKNAATKEIVASLLTTEECFLENVPHILDISLTLEMCQELGSQFVFEKHVLKIRTPKIQKPQVSKSYSGRNRIPILMVGPLLHRYGEAIVPVVGGDKIGRRPIDFHLSALEKMGAEINQKDNLYIIKAKRLHGAEIFLPYPSVGATENILLNGVLAEGRTIIRNAAIEPEIIDLVMVLQKMGAIIELKEDRTYIIDGVKNLRGFRHRVLPDRIEAGSFAAAAIASGGDIFIEGAEQINMVTFINKIRLVGGEIEVREGGIRFFNKKGSLRATNIETNTHPGFMTDWQPPFVVLLTQAHGESIIHETVFENRFGFTSELIKMGANIKLSTRCLGSLPCRFENKGFSHSCIVFGKTKLHGAKIKVPDIRAGFSYLIAASIAEGASEVFGVDHIERGYENIANKLRALGVKIKIKRNHASRDI